MLLNINKFIEDNELKEITTPQLMISGKFTDDGLYSTKIFGQQGSKLWRTTYAYIDLHCTVLHPLLYEIAVRRCSALIKLFEGSISIDPDTSEVLNNNTGNWGIDYFVQNTQVVIKALYSMKTLTESAKKLLSYILRHKDIAFVDKFIVAPPAYRPIIIKEHRIQTTPITDRYVDVINASKLILTIPSDAGPNYKRALNDIQVKLYNVFKELRNRIKGKGGLVRQSLLGKTLDFSGRAVIVGDPKIKPDEIGIPYTMAVAIFKPFIVYYAMRVYADQFKSKNVQPTMMNINRLLTDLTNGNKIDPDIDKLIRVITERIANEKVVLAKRDPSLHKLNVRAFKPVIVDDSSLHIHPTVTKGFGADFDGDQMAIYLPITEAAQKEAKEKMMVGKTLIAPNGELNLILQNDLILGLYYLSQPHNNSKLVIASNDIDRLKNILISTGDPQTRVKVGNKITSVGRAILSNIIGKDIEEVITKKNINNVLQEIYRQHGDRKTMDIIDELTKISVIVPTLIGGHMTPLDFKLPDDLRAKKEEAFTKPNAVEELEKITDEVLKRMKDAESIIADMLVSGARGNKSQLQNMVVAKGYVEDPEGKIIETPVKSAVNDGMTPDEYFLGAIGARKGIIDRSQNTSISGYLQRQYVYALSSVKFDPDLKSCGTKRFLTLTIDDKNLAKAFVGRYLSNGKEISDYNDIMDKQIEVYSPLYCTSLKLCSKCIGERAIKELAGSTNVGILVAQTLGERGTQLTLSTMHKGGLAEIKRFIDEDADLVKLVKQDATDIIALTDLQIEFDGDSIFGSDANEYLVNAFTIKSKDITVDLNLDYLFTIILPTIDAMTYDEDEDKYIVYFDKDMIVGSLKNATTSFTGASARLEKTLNNKKLRNEDLVLAIFNIYNAAGAISEMWQVEVLCSQLQRDPTNPALPWRLSGMKREPLRVSLKQVALLENWKRGAQFENISNALHYNILYGDDTHIESDLDNLISL